MSGGTNSEQHIVVVGGGIIGCTTAYYLTHHPSFSLTTTSVTLIEASVNGVAQGASGKAGGLVAKWAYPNELVKVSFREHVRLAREHRGEERWGWRYVGVGNWEGRARRDTAAGGGRQKSPEKTRNSNGNWRRHEKGLPDDLLWVDEDLADEYSPMAPEGATAQVHPYLFTTSMLTLAQSKGLQFITGQVISIERSRGRVTGVVYTSTGADGVEQKTTIPATRVVLAGGAWSPTLVPAFSITGLRAHSITIHPPSNSVIAPYALFTSITMPRSRKAVTPEIYARPGPEKEVYVCGAGDESPLPASVDDVVLDPAACEALREQVSSISKELREGTVMARQACFMPLVTQGGGPIIGEANMVAEGLVLAIGHTCWVSYSSR